MPFLFEEQPVHLPSKHGVFNISSPILTTSQKVLDIIFRYRSAIPKGAIDRSDEGALKALSIIYRAVKAHDAIRMVLPAFPFKSPNTKTKVLGTEPDKAEDVALAHLDGMCKAIQDIYGPGAKLVIVSDGLVYNDLLGVPDHAVWIYGQKLRSLAKSRGYDNIEFARLNDLLPSGQSDDPTDDMSYAAAASSMRMELMSTYPRIGCSSKNGQLVDNSENKRLTYCGYLKFLELDLATIYPINENRSKSQFKKGTEKIAKTMMQRGDAFARAVRDRYPDHVRLSIHPSTGEDKISINVLPVSNTLTPWHNCVGFKVDGTILAGHRRMFEDMDCMEAIEENGQLSYFREKSHLFNWGISAPVRVEHMYPCGIMIQPAAGAKTLSLDHIDAVKVRSLAEQNSPVVLRGFKKTKDRDRIVAKAYEFGQPTPWKFGLVLEVKDHGIQSQGLNNVLSSEWMPFHFDGMFKTETLQRKDGSKYLAPRPPKFQFFTAVTPSVKSTGYTLFAPSKLMFEHLPRDLPLEYLQILKWSVSTTSFDNSRINDMLLVTEHPATGRPCLRYHERWPQEKTRFDPTHVEIENGNQNICDVLEALLHDRRVCYWHAWEEGDLLINDNISTLHTRSSFTARTDRELWRIHFD